MRGSAIICRVRNWPPASSFRIEVTRPPVYERAFDRVARSWPGRLLALLALADPTGDSREFHRVVVTNGRGQRRTVAVLPAEDAERRCALLRLHLRDVGVEQWASEMAGQLPAAFFD
jgi:hypothetical protein